jgi:hypothetical protein
MCDDIKRLLLDLRNGTNTYYDEKRFSNRVKEKMSIRVTIGDFTELADIIDLSLNGCLYRTTKKLNKGEQADLNVYLPLFPEPINARGEVARIQRAAEDDGKFDIAMRFSRMHDPDRRKLVETLDILKKK